MSDASDSMVPEPTSRGEYVVVARRYRPQGFGDLVGQGMVTQALRNAIATDRVGHAYLFTGARGVGKTSTARILAKALNCVKGPTSEPCGQCDVCQQITGGEDVDVLEIDGASNRGIDEIRQLRSNVAMRPSRARFKVYIIDEVHMLTKEAFNALLKTLEEPPEHVKFIFCTTEPEKIPITVLSRCQRFDFAPVGTSKIVERLAHIVAAENAEAEPEALQLLARRAAGSMRDSQSLLEQLLSFVEGRITVNDVHTMLGTARDERLQAIIADLSARNPAGALQELDLAIQEGVDAGQLAEQLVSGFRDMMAALVGCSSDLAMVHAPADWEALAERARDWGLETLLAAVQIIDQSLSRMRHSTQPRILLEMAMVRVAHLEDLDDLKSLISQARSGSVSGSTDAPAARSPVPRTQPAEAAPSIKKNAPEVIRQPDRTAAADEVSSEGADAGQPAARVQTESLAPLTVAEGREFWRSAIAQLNDMTADFASHGECVAISGPNRLVVQFQPMYNASKSFCERPERRQTLEQAVSEVARRPIKLDFEMVREDRAHEAPSRPTISRQQLHRQVTTHPLVEQVVKMFEAEVLQVDASQGRSNE